MARWSKLLSSSFLSTVMAAAPMKASAAGEADQIRPYLSNNNAIRLVLKKDFTGMANKITYWNKDLEQIYSQRGYDSIWVRDGQLTGMGIALRDVLKSAYKQGLVPSEYWLSMLEGLSQPQYLPTYWATFELAATGALIQYARDLSTGRTNPDVIDDDIKFQRKELDFAALNRAIDAGASGLAAGLDALAPQNTQYQNLKIALSNMRQYQSIKAFNMFPPADKEVKPGSSHATLSKVKQKLRLLGYQVSESGPEYTSELETLIRQYQVDNGLYITSKLTPKSSFWNHIGVGAETRIKQIEMTMEKLRWLPRQLEARHVFVNLAFQKFKLYDSGELKLKMKTINGRPSRRTPVMRDTITTVEFNPTWTVPYSIATKDKLPEIKKDVNYLADHNIRVYDGADGVTELNPYAIDWASVRKGNFNYLLRQGSGLSNALGIMKFHLTNPWAIYFHDTNDRQLFGENQRLLSSGCIRLEKPMDLALYLLQDNRRWSTFDAINSVLATGTPGEEIQSEMKVPVSKPLPIYTMYLTSEVNEQGVLAFAEDQYGQDQRLSALFSRKRAALPGAGASNGTGTISFNVNPVKDTFAMAYRCNPAVRGACDEPVVWDVSKPATVPAGSYMVFFGGTSFPGWVRVDAGQNTVLQLSEAALPSSLAATGKRTVFRDLSNEIEQKKWLWAFYHLGREPIGMSIVETGFMGTAQYNAVDVTSRLNYSYCAKISKVEDATDEAREVCNIYNNARRPEDLRKLFEFHTDSTVTVSFAAFPGDRFKVRLKRIALSVPFGPETTSVVMIPGAARVAVEGQKNSTAFTSGQINETY